MPPLRTLPPDARALVPETNSPGARAAHRHAAGRAAAIDVLPPAVADRAGAVDAAGGDELRAATDDGTADRQGVEAGDELLGSCAAHQRATGRAAAEDVLRAAVANRVGEGRAARESLEAAGADGAAAIRAAAEDDRAAARRDLAAAGEAAAGDEHRGGRSASIVSATAEPSAEMYCVPPGSRQRRHSPRRPTGTRNRRF